MTSQLAPEPTALQSKVILWDSRIGNDVEKLLPEELAQTISIIRLVNYADVLECLRSRADIGLIVTVLRPTDLQMLYQIQQLQQNYTDLAIVALVGAVNKLANITKIVQRHIVLEQQQNLSLQSFDPQSQPPEAKPEVTGREATGEGNSIDCHLTPRQRDVLALLMRGQSNKQIARLLDLSEGTVKIHCMAIFRELGVANRTQAALRAEQLMPDLCNLD